MTQGAAAEQRTAAYIAACLLAGKFKEDHTNRRDALHCSNPEALALAQTYASIAQTQALVTLMRVVQQSGTKQLDNAVLDQIGHWEAAVKVVPVIGM